MMRVMALAAQAALGACGAGASTAGTGGEVARSEAGLEVVPLRIVSGGRTHRFQVEVARTPEQQSRGLMFRDRLAPDRGTMFPFASPRPATAGWSARAPTPKSTTT